jgi:hypothetical protein
MPQLSASGYYYPVNDGGNNYHPIVTPLNVSGSSSFSGNAYTVILGPIDVSKYSNYKISVINNSVNNLKSGSVEVSPDNVNWESIGGYVGSSSFTPLTSSGMASVQITGASNQLLRVKAWPSGSGGGLTGSLRVVVTANCG